MHPYLQKEHANRSWYLQGRANPNSAYSKYPKHGPRVRADSPIKSLYRDAWSFGANHLLAHSIEAGNTLLHSNHWLISKSHRESEKKYRRLKDKKSNFTLINKLFTRGVTPLMHVRYRTAAGKSCKWLANFSKPGIEAQIHICLAEYILNI